MLDVEILDNLKQGLAHDVKIRVLAEEMYGNYKPLEGFRGDDSVWHLESDHPLLPTVPHIYTSGLSFTARSWSTSSATDAAFSELWRRTWERWLSAGFA